MLKGSNMFEELFYSYLAKLNAKKLELAGLSNKWAYGFYEDGEVITQEIRSKFRDTGNKHFFEENPFLNNNGVFTLS